VEARTRIWLGACVALAIGGCRASAPPAPEAADGGARIVPEGGVPRTVTTRYDAGSDGGGIWTDAGFLEPVAILGAVSAAPLTSSQMIMPTHALETPSVSVAPSTPGVIDEWIAEGYGLTTLAAGEPLIDVAPPGQTVPTPGPSPTMLLRFVHLPDIQLVDDESPNRACNLDVPASLGATDGAFRPQEGDECRILDAAVRTVNALNGTLPLSFVLTGGDNTDNAQTNELQWFFQIMNGSPFVKCDSGRYNDPVPGPNNDGKDPFAAVGLDVPWWWVTGNHDVNIQGTLVVDESMQTSAVGTTALGETRDYAEPGAPLSKGPLIPDPRRVPLLRAGLMTLVAADGDGHGVGPTQVSSGKAFYSFDVAGTPLRFVILDTPAETGGVDGVIHQADVTSTIQPMLDQAQADGKWVILASHHSTDQVDDGSDFGGTAQADALTSAEWVSFLGGYDNILFSFVGHLHLHRSTYITPTSGHAFWEVMTSALADYPHEFRLVELWDDDNGWIRMRGVVTQYQTDDNLVAADGRALGMADQTSGWARDGFGTATDRNIQLYIPKP
jgi:hypothetical protein